MAHLDTPQILGYKRYIAVLNQGGTSAPSAAVQVNELGATMTWARSLAGIYTLTAGSAVFTASKTFVYISNPITGLVTYIAIPTSTTVITLQSLLASVVGSVLVATAGDGLITDLLIEVRVYP